MIKWVLQFILLMIVIRVIWKFLGGIIFGLLGPTGVWMRRHSIHRKEPVVRYAVIC